MLKQGSRLIKGWYFSKGKGDNATSEKQTQYLFSTFK